jgi:6-phosphogluconolactonase (cycloisomerase 2 family)
VSAFTIGADGALTVISGSPFGAGTNPAAVAIDASAKFVFVANSNSSDISTYAIASGGALSAVVPGPIRARLGPASLALSSGSARVTYTPTFAYVADNAFPPGVSALSVRAANGALTEVEGSPFGSGAPRHLAASPDGRFVYTANLDGTNTVGEYSINPTTGALTTMGTIATGSAPHGIAVDPSSRFVFASGIDTNAIYAYTINSKTGVLTSVVGSPFSGVNSPIALSVDPTGRFLMAAEACCANTAGISVFTVNSKTGELKLVPGSPFLPPTGTSEPTSVKVDPTGRYVYVANGEPFGTGGVTAYSINASTGKLTLTGRVLPGGVGPFGIATDATGKYVYMADADNTVSNSIYGYTIDNATGALTAMKGSPFPGGGPGTSTQGITVEASGKFLYVADTVQLLGYSIDSSTGMLSFLSTSPYNAGPGPCDVKTIWTIH